MRSMSLSLSTGARRSSSTPSLPELAGASGCDDSQMRGTGSGEASIAVIAKRAMSHGGSSSTTRSTARAFIMAAKPRALAARTTSQPLLSSATCRSCSSRSRGEKRRIVTVRFDIS
jgi:hypothetical protein